MEFLATDIVPITLSDSYSSLPDMDMDIKHENQDEDMQVTVFRALSTPKISKKSNNKFERHSPNSSYEVSTDSDEYM